MGGLCGNLGTGASSAREALSLGGTCYFCEDRKERKWETVHIHTKQLLLSKVRTSYRARSLMSVGGHYLDRPGLFKFVSRRYL